MNEVDFKTEIEQEYSDDSLLNLVSYGADLSVRELINMFNEKELVKPDLQRNYVWDKKIASRFIDSILLGLPVPSIFLAKDIDEKLLIIDGFQRITTLVDFYAGIFSKTGRLFRLHNSDLINERWRNKTFAELLPEYQRRIKNYTLHAIIFERKNASNKDTAMYQIFERINTGGRTLSSQEIRNCVYHGELNNLLICLNDNEIWRKLYGEKLDERMKDIELILRFFALKDISYGDVKFSNLNKYLNEYMCLNQNPSEYQRSEMKKVFEYVITFVENKFGTFMNENIKKIGKILHLETLMICSYLYLYKHNFDYSSFDGGTKIKNLLVDDDYFGATNSHTTDINNILVRIKKCLSIVFGIES